jgi:hypothetical protein
MSISCMFFAEGAVRFPESGRLMPLAAQRRSESTFMGRGCGLNVLAELLFARICINGLSAVRGFESGTGFGSSAQATVETMNKRIVAKTPARQIAPAGRKFAFDFIDRTSWSFGYYSC